jgi:ParB-like chromosome segregation protein Spo0J/DNA modification methylase
MIQEIIVDIEDIKVIDRAREDLDVADLARSISDVGLLQAIIINSANELLDGGRRLTACKQLGHLSIPCRVIESATVHDRLIIELVANQERKDFTWHEDVMLKKNIHTELEEANKEWSLRKTAKKLQCAIGGLSSDLAIAAAINVFPHLKELASKAKAREAYKKLSGQAEASIALKNLSEDDKSKLNMALSGGKIPGLKTVQDTPHDNASSSPHDKHTTPGVNVPEGNETPLQPTVESAIPEFYYHIGTFQELFKHIPDSTVGFAELDPPYAIDFNNVYGKVSNIKTTAEDWTVEKLKDQMTQLFKILYAKMLDNSWVLCWTGKEHSNLMNVLAANAGFQIQPPGVWTKDSGASNTPKTTMISQYEMYLLMRKGKAQFNTASFPNVLRYATVPSSQRNHQWQKPVELYNRFQEACGRPGSIFVSPFAGSGTSMVSAAINKMTPMGADNDKQYFPRFVQTMKDRFINKEMNDEKI